MERLIGIKLSEPARLAASGIDTDEVARRGAAICLKMIFDHGFYHADPHPANLMVMEGCTIGLLDFGMVGRIDERLHEQVSEMLVALSNLDAEHTTAMLVRFGKTPFDLDRSALALRHGRFSLVLRQPTARQARPERRIERDVGADTPLPHRAAGADRHAAEGADYAGRDRPGGEPEVQLDRDDSPLSAEADIAALPSAQLRKLRRLYSELEHLVNILPQGIADILEQMQSGRFDIHLDHRGLEPSVNRLVLGMLASAFIVAASLLLSRAVGPQLFGLSALGLLAGVIGVGMALRLWLAISKSGHLDRKKRD